MVVKLFNFKQLRRADATLHPSLRVAKEGALNVI